MDESIAAKLLMTGTVLAGLVLAFFAATFISEENYFMLILILGGIFGLIFVLISGSRYWILVPVAINSSFPALPVGGGRFLEFAELAAIGCGTLFIVNAALKREQFVFVRATHIPILVFIGWVGFIYMLNPSGMAIFGSSNVGGRFYLKLALAFVAFLMTASKKVSEKDIRLLFTWLLIIVFPSTAYSIWVGMRIPNPLATGMAEYYTWHQNLATPALLVSILMFCKWPPSLVFSPRKWFLILFYALAIFVTLHSGKRMAVLSILILPVLSALVWKEYKYIIFGGILAGAIMLVIGLGHNKAFTFPKTVQRALSWLPAEWDPEFEHMKRGQDDWREELRMVAKKIASENPVFGTGYSMDSELMAAELFVTEAIGTLGGMGSQIAAYASGRAWHNVWFGYTADFGLPVTIAHAFILLVSVVVSYKVATSRDVPPAFKMFAIYCFITTFMDVYMSHTSGHTANDAFSRWWKYGLMFAIFEQVSPRLRRRAVAESRKPGKIQIMQAAPRMTDARAISAARRGNLL